MKINRGQLIAFLNLISLKGIDDEVKMRKLVNDTIIHFTDDGMWCFGVDDTENIVFNHVYEVDYTEENEDPKVIIINDITKWIAYLQGFKTEEISLAIEDATIVISAGPVSYRIPLSVPESIRSYQKSDREAMIPYKDDWYDIETEKGDKSPKEDWSEFNFTPAVFIDSIGSGRNVDNMNLKLHIAKKSMGIEIGDINDPATPSFTNVNLDGVNNQSWTFKVKEKIEWSCELGLHSIIASIDMITHPKLPSMFLREAEGNLIIKTSEGSKLQGSEIKATWAIATPEDADDDDDEEFYEDDK